MKIKLFLFYVLLFLKMLIQPNLYGMEVENNFWIELPQACRKKIVKFAVLMMAKNKDSLYHLHKMICDLKTVDKQFLQDFDSIFHKKDRFINIYKLAKAANQQPFEPISSYALAQALLNKKNFERFQYLSKIKTPDCLGSELLNSIHKIKVDELKNLIKKGLNLNFHSDDRSTALMRAISFKRNDLIEILIKAGTDLNIQNEKGLSAIMLAAHLGQYNTVEALINAGANINLSSKDGSTALSYAVANNKFKTVQLLLQYHALTDTQNNLGETPLIIACSKNYFEIAKILIAANANVNIKNNDGNTALILAIKKSNKSIANMLLGMENTLKYKIRSTELLDIQNNLGETALIWACKNEKLGIVKALIKLRANLNIQDKYGNTALHYASLSNFDITQQLIQARARLDLQNSEGRNALMIMVIRYAYKILVGTLNFSEPEIIDLLVKAGTNLNLKDNRNKTAYDYAKELNIPHKNRLKPKRHKKKLKK